MPVIARSPNPLPKAPSITLYSEGVSAGFPSPAQDYVEKTLDLNELCIKRPVATFFVRVDGNSMIEAGIFNHDILVVDRSITASHGDIVIACIDNDMTVKELQLRPYLALLPHNAQYSPIIIGPEDALEIFGVVTCVIRKLKN